MTKPYRQGNVLFKKIRSLPKGERRKRSNATVAYGSVTGHSHRLAPEDQAAAEVFEIGDGIFVRISRSGASIVHEEHGPIRLPAGNYQVTIQREYIPGPVHLASRV